MTWDSMIGLVLFALLQMGAISFGYWMGRNSVGKEFSETPRKHNPGPSNGEDRDVYRDALKPVHKIGKRIPTI